MRRILAAVACFVLAAVGVRAQSATRLAVLLAEERRAPTANDVAVIRAGVRSYDTDTALVAIRALGRLERPALIPDIASALRFELPELRAEAANAIATALGRPGAPVPASLRSTVSTAFATLAGRLEIETDANVRGALYEALGRLPYSGADQTGQAERTLIAGAASGQAGVAERLGVAKGLEAFVRIGGADRPASPDVLAALRTLFGLSPAPPAPGDAAGAPADIPPPPAGALDSTRDARVRRLALEALTTANAVDDALVVRGMGDADMQVRRLAMAAAARADQKIAPGTAATVIAAGLIDPAPIVRIEALHAEASRETGSHTACALAFTATADPDIHVVLAAIDALGVCGTSTDAVTFLERTVDNLSGVNAPRGWHRTAHALVALAGAEPERAKALLVQFTNSSLWPLRLYAVRAATVLNDRDTLERMMKDADPQVADEAARQYSRVSGVVDPPPAPARAAPPAGDRLPASALTAADLKRLAAARARVTVRDVGTFELALLASEAPATVLRFARLAESGYYNGLTIDRVLPNFVVQTRGASPDDLGVEPTFPREELGAWPHVRGVVAASAAGGRSAAALFIDLVDNPRFDHQYTAFAQALNGLDVIDALLEGDVIERIEIEPGP